MATTKKVLYRPPKGSPYLVRVKVDNTKHLRNSQTGLFEGRKKVRRDSKEADKFKRYRVKEPFILVKKSKTAKGHIRKQRSPYGAGEFF